MQCNIENNPVSGILRVELGENEQFRAEAGAMMSMSPSVILETQSSGKGFLGTIKATIGGESLFASIFRTESQGGEVILAPSLQGEIIEIEMNGETILAESGAYLASTQSLELSTQGSLKGFLAGEGLFLQKISGQGRLFVSAYGNILSKTLAPNEKYIVDSGHIVAFDASMSYQIKKSAKGLFATFASGEGLVSEFTGPGRLWMQTRNLSVFASALSKMLPRGK